MSDDTTTQAPMTAQEAYDWLVKAVATRDESYVYVPRAFGGCVYSYEGKPDCLIGVALVLSGRFTLEELAVKNQANIRAVYRDEPSFRERISESALNVLSAAQTAQDSQKTWGEALKRAQEVLTYATAIEDNTASTDNVDVTTNTTDADTASNNNQG